VAAFGWNLVCAAVVEWVVFGVPMGAEWRQADTECLRQLITDNSEPGAVATGFFKGPPATREKIRSLSLPVLI
jgi:hypothetical protein